MVYICYPDQAFPGPWNESRMFQLLNDFLCLHKYKEPVIFIKYLYFFAYGNYF